MLDTLHQEVENALVSSLTTRIRIRVQARGGKYLGPGVNGGNSPYALVTILNQGKVIFGPTLAIGNSGTVLDQPNAPIPSGASPNAITVMPGIKNGPPGGAYWLLPYTIDPTTGKKTDAAGVVATFSLDKPALLEFRATALYNTPNPVTTSSMMWVVPGDNLLEEPGVLLTMPGLNVVLDPCAVDKVGNKSTVTITSTITMMCGCPISAPAWPANTAPVEPYWPYPEFGVTAILTSQSGNVRQQEMKFSKTDTFTTTLIPPSAGKYRLAVRAIQPLESNIGYAEKAVIFGDALTNELKGTGEDVILIGLDGNDNYLVDSNGDQVLEAVDSGNDQVKSLLTSYTLPNNVENLILAGSKARIGLGNELDNRVTGNANNNLLNGNTGNDTLKGGTGLDTLIGGLGDDTYVVDTATDTILENLQEGIDTIRSSVSLSLAAIANVENLTLTGSNNLNGTGNALNNLLTGNSGNNRLSGGAGNDTLDGRSGIDTLIGGTGNDTYIVNTTTDVIVELAGQGTDTICSSVSFSLAAIANVENLTLTGSRNLSGTGNALNNRLMGNSGNNRLSGEAGNDTLNGVTGIDTLIGGTGNDTYIVDTTTNIIVELAGQGKDTIRSSISCSLAGLPDTENLVLTGIAAINGTGNSANNAITGNSGNNFLTGAAGKDTLTGGSGSDQFNYQNLEDSLLAKYDSITDFKATTDHDYFRIATALQGFNNVGAVSRLDANGISAKLTNSTFAANYAAQFTFGSRTFIAINDIIAGFNAATDAIVEIKGLTGIIEASNFTT